MSRRRHAPSRALVTGASRGIGKAFARRLATDGADLVLVARTAEALHDLAAELEDAHHVAVEVLPADLTDPDDLAAVVDRLTSVRDPIDLLVNNAGFGTAGAFADADIERETALIDLNVRTVVRLTHAALEAMLDAGGGAVINVSSITSFQPGPYGAAYAASKAFVRSFTEGLYEELRNDPVDVLALCPGFTRTEIFAHAGGDTTAVPGPLWMEPEGVVEAAFDALADGRAVCVPGTANRLFRVASRYTLPSVVRSVAGFVGRRF